MKNVLVFGGFGFLGSYLVNELINRGYNVTVADVKDRQEENKNITYIECDISSNTDVDRVFEMGKFEIVYNLAGFANLDDAIKSPIRTIQLKRA